LLNFCFFYKDIAMNCACIIASGPRKGQRCLNTAKDNGFCGVHKNCKNAIVSSTSSSSSSTSTSKQVAAPAVAKSVIPPALTLQPLSLYKESLPQSETLDEGDLTENFGEFELILSDDIDRAISVLNDPPGPFNPHLYFIKRTKGGLLIAEIYLHTSAGYFYVVEGPDFERFTGKVHQDKKLINKLLNQGYKAMVGHIKDNEICYFNEDCKNLQEDYDALHDYIRKMR
jgi:hypothetical protein